ncbi:hypothetical protein BU17DRAFT_62469 [Hysterangium stoloniferum]|nr:hypothetical protein BU17DRAFT_62469 [Hysterangium stoloniferum]
MDLAIRSFTVYAGSLAQGMYPGSTIDANQADRLVVHVKNNLPNATIQFAYNTAVLKRHKFLRGSGRHYGVRNTSWSEFDIQMSFHFPLVKHSSTAFLRIKVSHSVDSQEPPGGTLTVSAFAHVVLSQDVIVDSTQYTDDVRGALTVHPTLSLPPEFPSWDEEIVI